MHPRRKILAAVAGLAAAVLTIVASPAAAAAQPARPYQGSCSTVIVPLTDPGPVQQLRIDYSCTLAHLGRTSAVANQTVTFAGQSGGSAMLLVHNTTTYTAANGDQLLATFRGTATLDLATGEVAYTGVELFNGGSGRFANATGSAQLDGTASVFTNRGAFISKGKIAD